MATITLGSSGEPGGASVSVDAETALTLGTLHQVVAAAEPFAISGQEHHVDLGVEVGPLDTPLELGDEAAGDPVAALGTVERQACDRSGDLVGDGAHTGSARSMMAPASTPPGSVPYTRPESPPSLAAQNASATAGGA